MEENKEKCIGKLIHSRIPIEWMRYNMYIEDDRYRNIPMSKCVIGIPDDF